jgi:two-component system sensor histidine kinase DevS
VTQAGPLRPLSEIGLSDDLVWSVLEAAPDAMLLTDAHGQILLVNRQTESMFGYERTELLGKAVEELVPERFRDVHRAHRTRYRAEPRTRAMGAGSDLVGRRRDGTEFPVEISLSPLNGPTGLLVVASVRDISERLETEEQLRHASEELRLLEDRERIARNLHDNVIQRLFAAGMSMQAIAAMLTTENQAAARRMDGIIDELDETIRDIRTAIYGLQPQSGRRGGLRHQILRIVEEQQSSLGAEPRVRFDGLIDAVPDEIAEHLLASLREALSNVARHARATNIEVVVEAGDEVTLRVLDDGVGIAETPSSGYGIGNMVERAASLGGSFRAVPRDGTGTLAEWRVPNGSSASRPS